MNLLQRLCGAVIDASDKFGASMQGVDLRTHRARMYGHPDGIVAARLEGPVAARAEYPPQRPQTWPVESRARAFDADDEARRQQALEPDISPWVDEHRPTHESKFVDLDVHLHDEAPWPHDAHSAGECSPVHEPDVGPAAHDEQLVNHHHDNSHAHHHDDDPFSHEHGRE